MWVWCRSANSWGLPLYDPNVGEEVDTTGRFMAGSLGLFVVLGVLKLSSWRHEGMQGFLGVRLDVGLMAETVQPLLDQRFRNVASVFVAGETLCWPNDLDGLSGWVVPNQHPECGLFGADPHWFVGLCLFFLRSRPWQSFAGDARHGSCSGRSRLMAEELGEKTEEQPHRMNKARDEGQVAWSKAASFVVFFEHDCVDALGNVWHGPLEDWLAWPDHLRGL